VWKRTHRERYVPRHIRKRIHAADPTHGMWKRSALRSRKEDTEGTTEQPDTSMW
jgi:hypothetical protein